VKQLPPTNILSGYDGTKHPQRTTSLTTNGTDRPLRGASPAMVEQNALSTNLLS